MSRRFRLALLTLGLATAPLVATEIVWPTDLDLTTVRSAQDYLQPTVSGRLESATFGMVREDGQRFHEGVDIRPGRLDAAGEALDLVRAAMDGQVAYANPHVNGPYGRYVVLSHPGAEIPVYSLYAHLASIDPAVKPGRFVRRGLILGRLGRTSAGATPITPDRAHLHFEVGLLLSTGFNGWYAAQPENRKSPNLHGLYNGQNLIGMDPLPVLGQRSVDLLALVRRQPTALTVVLRAARTPDFVRRYPALARGEASAAAGWHVEFSWQGMPLRWTALEAGNPRLPAQGWQIAEVDVSRRPLLIRRKMLAPDGRKPGELLTQNVGILLSTAR
ncbi:MAG: M23 family metallopeptidase [Verrucomicrobia bacterium]|nr:M23 family metallopeptidase [Verrucomicrobiota bacterium]